MRFGIPRSEPPVDLADPAKIRAATTYNAAADNFDAEPLGFWDRYGRGTVARLDLRPGARAWIASRSLMAQFF